MLMTAAVLLAVLGLVHSLLGERYMLVRLFRRPDLPKLFGSTAFMIQTLRFAWHITTLMAWGAAVLLIQLSAGASHAVLLRVLGGTFLACALLPLGFTKGRHLSWIVFSAVGILCLLGAR